MMDSNCSVSQEVATFLNVALRYASGDNAQPFRLKMIDATSFQVHHHPEIGRHALNPNFVSSWISLGFFIEGLRLVAGAAGWDLREQAQSELGQAPVCTIGLVRAKLELSEAELALARGLEKRETNRGLYGTEALSADQWQDLKALSLPGVTLMEWPITPNWVEYLDVLEDATWKMPEMSNETFKWIRFNLSKEPPPDGMSWRNVGLKWWMVPSVAVFAKQPSVFQFLSQYGATKINRDILKAQLQASAHLGAFQISKTDTTHVLNLGRTALRVWSQLNLWGYGYQPLTIPFLPAHCHFQGMAPSNWPVHLCRSYEQACVEFKMAAQEWPIWGFRTGPAAPLAPECRAGRIPLHNLWL